MTAKQTKSGEAASGHHDRDAYQMNDQTRGAITRVRSNNPASRREPKPGRCLTIIWLLLGGVLVSSWMWLIYFLSSKPNLEALPYLKALFRKLGYEGVLKGPLWWLSEFVLRKSAHFAEFAVLTILVMILLNGLAFARKTPLKGRYLWAMLIGCLYAIADEIHQIYVPGRDGRLFDVIVDVSGGTVGLGLFWMAERLKALVFPGNKGDRRTTDGVRTKNQP